MKEACSGGSAGGATSNEGRHAPSLGAADWLGLAAAPTFAVMALLTSVLGSGKMAAICGTAQEPSSIGGMVSMYLLMSGFHSAPWLKLLANRRCSARRS